MKLRYVAVLGAAVAGAACAADLSLGPADGDRPIRTDAAEYELRYQPGMYTLHMRAEYTNRTGKTVYLHRQCGYSDRPHRHLVRADTDSAPIWLGAGFCITQPLRAPIPVAPGETYADEFQMWSTESPNAQPPITMAQRTGTFRLVYHVQRTDRVEGWEGVDLLPLEQRVSNVFQVKPPQ